eukprot:Protomagalhaensia_wolfi_Nauph_80__1729@NODE_2075_length_1223_cov_1289_725507_g1621_i0_p1_GENE_NODE_2075_length_1223_cov_1289_725507_g1621_i0NODE_2075_length_1223_cov_1289_725507_g1621_i0_p1_ORF_typecomplete_len316_score42_28H_PPase/PF03030_16/0_028EnoRase_NADH_b/PF12242_8/5_2e02EnoRase_NADH_b/PF12242_8/0_35_NODE_2075_length_1223_cov_1289_725507_g1621_i02051152
MTRAPICLFEQHQPKVKRYGLAAGFAFATANGNSVVGTMVPYLQDCVKTACDYNSKRLTSIIKELCAKLNSIDPETLQAMFGSVCTQVRGSQPQHCGGANFASSEAHTSADRFVNMVLSTAANHTLALTGDKSAATPFTLYQAIPNLPGYDEFQAAALNSSSFSDAEVQQIAMPFLQQVLGLIASAGGVILTQAEELANALTYHPDGTNEDVLNQFNVTCLTNRTHYVQDDDEDTSGINKGLVIGGGVFVVLVAGVIYKLAKNYQKLSQRANPFSHTFAGRVCELAGSFTRRCFRKSDEHRVTYHCDDLLLEEEA